ncbi:FUSC family membrane protein [Shigella flexneri]
MPCSFPFTPCWGRPPGPGGISNRSCCCWALSGITSFDLNRHLLFRVRPLQDNIARSEEQLAHYLELKSRLFEPDIEEDSQAQL